MNLLTNRMADTRKDPTIANIEAQINMSDDRWVQHIDLEKMTHIVFSAAAQATIGNTADSYEVSILFCDDNRMSKINAKWRGVNKSTNVLSFPAAERNEIHGYRTLGDIAIAFETCQTEAESYNIDFEDHVKHMLVHGFLHLLGYDHECDEDATEMEALEVSILSDMNVQNPYHQLVPDQENKRDDG